VARLLQTLSSCRTEYFGRLGMVKVSFGSNSEVPARNWEVRFALRNGHHLPDLRGPKSAIS
jgi:hypothetical protein